MATDTMPRTPGTPQAPGRTQPRRPAPRGPVPGRPAPGVGSPRHTRPVTAPAPRTAPGVRPRARTPRMAFIVLLVGLLGGALVSLLVISTTLASGSFQIANLKQQNANLARQEQALTDEVAQESNPATIAREAQQLGMRQNPYLRFVNLKTGKVITGKASRAEKAIHVPGYIP